MQIRPPKIELASAPIQRTHKPKKRSGKRGYQKYRQCLRWDFGFTCALCGLHETDFKPTGVEGLAITSVEHATAQSEDCTQRNDYGNCLYACMLCNNVRRAMARSDSSGRKLLDPTDTAWADHFVLRDHAIVPLEGDEDAAYTAEAYDLGDPRKERMRKFSAELIDDRLSLLGDGLKKADRLLEVATKQKSRADAQTLVAAAGELYRAATAALRELALYRAVPDDAAATCNCSRGASLKLAAHIRAQAVTVADLDTRQGEPE